ncbi:hypothetical protein ACLMJK_000960 [Lecanora helva]
MVTVSTEVSPMTPIRVRGKKQSNPKFSLNSLLNPSAKGKRPISSTLASSASSKKSRHANANSPGRDAIGASPLESLPTEILEIIFFDCLNVALPQCSLIIGRKLASYHVKSQLTLKVLSSTSSTHYTYPWAATFPTIRERAEAQTTILRLRWMTWQFLKDLIPDFIVRTLVRELGERRLRWMGEGPVVSPASEPLIRQHLKDNAYRLDEIDPGEYGLPAYWELEWQRTRRGPLADALSEHFPYDPDSETIRVGVGLQDGLVTIGGLPLKNEWMLQIDVDHLWPFDRWRILCGVEGCRIPEKLLHGPWSDEKCSFLEVAIRGNATVDWIGTTGGEVAKEGLLHAIEENNARAIRALSTREDPPDSFGTGFFINRDNAPHEYRFSNYRDLPIRRGVGLTPTKYHVRTAVANSDCSEVLDAILEAREHLGDSDAEILKMLAIAYYLRDNAV